MTAETFYLSLRCLKTDVQESIRLYEEAKSLGKDREVFTTESIRMLIKLFVQSNRVDEAIELYRQVFLEYHDLSPDIIIVNIVLKFTTLSRKSLSVSEAVQLVHQVIGEGIKPHHSSFALLLSAAIQMKSHDLIPLIESIMKSSGLSHTHHTRRSMIISAYNSADYKTMFQVYNDMISARIIPSSEVLLCVVKILNRIEENAIAIRIIAEWLKLGARMDWVMMRMILTLVDEQLVISQRYPHKESIDIAHTTQDSNPKEVEEDIKADQQIPRNRKSHLDYLSKLSIDIDQPFAENLSFLRRYKLELIDLVCRMISSRFTSSDPYSTANSNIPHDITLSAACHLTVRGDVDRVLRELQLLGHFNPTTFWPTLFNDFLTQYPREWRIMQSLWERVRYDVILPKSIKLELYAATLKSLFYSANKDLIRKFIDVNQEYSSDRYVLNEVQSYHKRGKTPFVSGVSISYLRSYHEKNMEKN